MDMEFGKVLLEIIIKVNGRQINNKALEFINIQIAYIKDIFLIF